MSSNALGLWSARYASCPYASPPLTVVPNSDHLQPPQAPRLKTVPLPFVETVLPPLPISLNAWGQYGGAFRQPEHRVSTHLLDSPHTTAVTTAYDGGAVNLWT